MTFRHKVIAAELQTGLWSAAKARVQGHAFGLVRRFAALASWGSTVGIARGKRSHDRSRQRLALQRSACWIAAEAPILAAETLARICHSGPPPAAIGRRQPGTGRWPWL